MTKSEERETRDRFERWVDERIHSALSNLSQPFELRIQKLQKRLETLKERFQKLSHHQDSVNPKADGVPSRKKSGSGSRA